MLELTIKANNPEELRLQLLGMLSTFKGVNFVQNGKTVDTTPVDGSNVGADIGDIKPVLSEEQIAENLAKAPEHEMPPVPTLEEVRAVLKTLRDRKGADAVKELLKAYSAKSVPDLKPEDYLGVVSRARLEA